MKSWRTLNREIQSVAWNQLIHMILYKAENANKELILVDPRNTSKMCSNCGNIVEKKLSERIHKCECGLKLDRDHNAAINIFNRGLFYKPRESWDEFSESLRSLRL